MTPNPTLPSVQDPLARRRRGRFVVLEGIDGAGTTTQAARLREALNAAGERTMGTCEPSDGPMGMLLRQALTGRLVGHKGDQPAPLDAVTLALLFAADRADHVAQVVMPLVDSGVTVICDRYVLSSIAYQGLELDAAFVAEINRKVPSPDITFFLDVPPKVAQKRRLATRAREELYDALAVQQHVDRNYRAAIAARKNDERIEMIDGTVPPDQVTARLVELLAARKQQG